MEKMYSRDKGSNVREGHGGKALMMVGSVLKAVIFTFMIFMLVAYLLTHTEFSESFVSPIVIATSMLSCFIIGFDFSKRNKERGLIFGSLGGLVYLMFYIVVGMMLSNDVVFDSRTVIVLLFGILSGSLGGVFGVNKK